MFVFYISNMLLMAQNFTKMFLYADNCSVLFILQK